MVKQNRHLLVTDVYQKAWFIYPAGMKALA